ncbi:MAG: hypothetical protein WB791_08700, partial [Waddliaceae bacterium]
MAKLDFTKFLNSSAERGFIRHLRPKILQSRAKQFILFFILFTCAAATLPADMQLGDQRPSGFFSLERDRYIFINNRILSQVNGKAISIVDVMKKMDLLFYRQFPQYSSSVEARFQFYEINWRHVWEDLVDKELILAEAAENKIGMTNGDIRQEME